MCYKPFTNTKNQVAALIYVAVVSASIIGKGNVEF